MSSLFVHGLLTPHLGSCEWCRRRPDTAHVSSMLISFSLGVDPKSEIDGSCGFVIYFYFQVQRSGHPDFLRGRTNLHTSTVCGHPSLCLLPLFIIFFK